MWHACIKFLSLVWMDAWCLNPTLQDNWAIAINLLQRKIIRGNILYYHNDNFSVANNYSLLQRFTIVVLFSIFVAIGNELLSKKHYYCKKKCSIATNLNFCGNLHRTWYFSLFSIAMINKFVAIKNLTSHNLTYYFHMDKD